MRIGKAVRRIYEVARDYESKGYQVFVGPTTKDTPAFLTAFKPDIIACKEEDRVVVEVVSATSQRKSEKELSELNRVLREAGWRLEIATTQEVEEKEEDEEGTEYQELTTEEIGQWLEKAKSLCNTGELHSALLTAWPAFESALRQGLKKEGVKWPNSHMAAVSLAFSEGMIDQRALETLRECLSARNRIVHGFKSPVSREWIEALISASDEILAY